MPVFAAAFKAAVPRRVFSACFSKQRNIVRPLFLAVFRKTAAMPVFLRLLFKIAQQRPAVNFLYQPIIFFGFGSETFGHHAAVDF